MKLIAVTIVVSSPAGNSIAFSIEGSGGTPFAPGAGTACSSTRAQACKGRKHKQSGVGRETDGKLEV